MTTHEKQRWRGKKPGSFFSISGTQTHGWNPPSMVVQEVYQDGPSSEMRPAHAGDEPGLEAWVRNPGGATCRPARNESCFDTAPGRVLRAENHHQDISHCAGCTFGDMAWGRSRDRQGQRRYQTSRPMWRCRDAELQAT